MKHWSRRMGIKALCFLLSVPLLAAAVLSGIWIGAQWEEGVYTQSQQELVNAKYNQYFISDGLRMVVDNRELFQGEPPQTPEDIMYWSSSARYGIYDLDDNLYATNIGDLENAQFTMEVGIAAYMESDIWQCYYVELDELGLAENWKNFPDKLFILRGFVDNSVAPNSRYSAVEEKYEQIYSLRYPMVAVCLGCAILGLLCVFNLLLTASKRPKQDTFAPGAFHKVPGDLMVFLWVIALGLSWEEIFRDYRYYNGYYGSADWYTAVMAVWVAALAYICLGLLVGTVGRARQGCLIKNTVCYKLCRWLVHAGKKLGRLIKEFYVNLPLIWRSVLGSLAFGLWALLLWVSALAQSALSVVLLLAAPVMMAAMVYAALQLRKLQKGGRALAEGNLSYHVDTKGLIGALREHGENLNSIGMGMSRALEGRLKSERMKTELVTNVSHDIKNPLTSIINYAGLIAAESCENEHHREYAKVLERKSEHLKRLLEDLVEISRASTGNMEMDLQPCDALTFLEQLAGEFEERCAGAELTLITRQPETPLGILADSRRIWRVFENLMQNACKYSLPGSRVYLTLEQKENNAVFTLRNTSKEPLNISPEELMERFVRGDSARTTEGNGLGLSIAQSLTHAQGGEMTVTIDGDLFKVTVSFPLAK